MLRERIRQLLSETVETLQTDDRLPFFSLPDPLPLERPPDPDHGDVATPLAMAVAAEADTDPMTIASTIAKALREDPFMKETTVAAPGFINMTLAPSVWNDVVAAVREQGESYGHHGQQRGSASVEFISVNPTGPLHVAHGRGAFYGDALARIMAAAGWDVLREYYVNASHHNTQIEELGKALLGTGDQYSGPFIEELRNRIDVEGLDAMAAGFEGARAIQEHNQAFIVQELNIAFDEWVWEESLFEEGLVDKAFSDLEKKDVIEERDGAQWFIPSAVEGVVPEEHDMDDEDLGWVVVRSNGSPSYLLPDIAYHRFKADRGHDRIIDVLGADHQGHEEKLQAVAELFGFDDALEVIITQMVQIAEGGETKKMSKRAGTAVDLAWLIDAVGLDAARFFFLMKSVNTHMEFDIALAQKESQENPVYYVQYAHTRCAGIMRKAHDAGYSPGESIAALEDDAAAQALVRQVAILPEVVEDVARTTEVHRLPHYLVDLADAFHHFYHAEQVLVDDEAIRDARLALVAATKQVLANGLALLGVTAPETM